MFTRCYWKSYWKKQTHSMLWELKNNSNFDKCAWTIFNILGDIKFVISSRFTYTRHMSLLTYRLYGLIINKCNQVKRSSSATLESCIEILLNPHTYIHEYIDIYSGIQVTVWRCCDGTYTDISGVFTWEGSRGILAVIHILIWKILF